MASAREFFLGTPARTEQISLLDPDQQKASQQLLQRVLGMLQNPQEGFQPIADQARRQFQQETIPSLAERFTQLGSQRSSAFTGELGKAGVDLESNLASLGSQYGQRNLSLLLPLLQMALQPRSETVRYGEQTGALENVGLPLLQALSSFIPLAGPAISQGLGSLGNYFKNRPQRQFGGGAMPVATTGSASPSRAWQPYQSSSFNNLSLLQGGL